MPRQSSEEPAKQVVIRDSASIKWGNGLITGQWSLTVQELRLLFALSSQIEPGQERFELSEAPISELGAMMGLSQGNMYSVINNAALSLGDKRLFFRLGDTWVKSPWFSIIGYDDSRSVLCWRFNDDIAAALLNLKSAYVRYAAKPLMGFKSIYAGRWFLLALQYERLGAIDLSVDDVRKLFELGSKYAAFKDFYRNVVAAPVKEINEFSDLHIDVTPIKTKRQYTRLEVRIGRKQGAGDGKQAPVDFIDAPARQIRFFENAGARRAEAQDDGAESPAGGASPLSEGARALMERMAAQGKRIKDIVRK